MSLTGVLQKTHNHLPQPATDTNWSYIKVIAITYSKYPQALKTKLLADKESNKIHHISCLLVFFMFNQFLMHESNNKSILKKLYFTYDVLVTFKTNKMITWKLFTSLTLLSQLHMKG